MDNKKAETILVVGNGPSCAEIDFSSVPKNAKIMRVSGFFREEKYYVGKSVDYYVDYFRRIDDVYFTIRTLKDNGEYDINLQEIWMTVMDSPNPFFPAVKDCTGFIQQNKLIAEFRNFYMYYYGQYVPTGLQALALAFCLGYETIYAAGFDLLSDKHNMHPFPVDVNDIIRVENIKSISEYETHVGNDFTEEKRYEKVMKNHPVDMQVRFIQLLKELFPKTQLLSVTDNSPINELIGKAPKLYDDKWYVPQQKPATRIKAFLPLPDTMPKILKSQEGNLQ